MQLSARCSEDCLRAGSDVESLALVSPVQEKSLTGPSQDSSVQSVASNSAFALSPPGPQLLRPCTCSPPCRSVGLHVLGGILALSPLSIRISWCSVSSKLTIPSHSSHQLLAFVGTLPTLLTRISHRNPATLQPCNPAPPFLTGYSLQNGSQERNLPFGNTPCS